MIFVNDFPNCLRSSQGNMFADDTISYAQGTTTEEVKTYSSMYVMLVSGTNTINLASVSRNRDVCYLEHVKGFIIIHIWRLF